MMQKYQIDEIQKAIDRFMDFYKQCIKDKDPEATYQITLSVAKNSYDRVHHEYTNSILKETILCSKIINKK